MTTAKKFIAIFLLFGILSNCLSFWVLSTSYALNKSYIATVLCTNKAKPELHCEGKCFMDIKLKELEQKNKQAQENLKRAVETVAPNSTSLLASIFGTVCAQPFPYYLPKDLTSTQASIFQPPKLA
ncbi:MAG: hypothetical protein EOO07_09310 [Chitinophagaceae bacterium]|nr:MAG: hypothetical protein EOO07_09310 [Chitinophagaceae bacterium]